MKFLTYFFSISLMMASFGCVQSTANKNTSDTQGAAPASSMVNRNNRFDAGKLEYDSNCKVCHQVNRMGMPPAFPPIKNTTRVNGNKDYLIDVVLNGMSGEIAVEGVKYNGVMTAYRHLSDQQIADVLNYIRSDGKAADDMVTPEQVKKRR